MGQIAVGAKIPLTVSLEGPDPSSKYVRAVLTDADNNPLAGSPVDLAFVSGNLFENNDVDMPETAYVQAQFTSYDDAGYSVQSTEFVQGSAVERFDRDISGDVLDKIMNQVIAKINGLAVPGAAIKTILVQNIVKEAVSDSNAAKGIISDDDVNAVVTTDQRAKGLVASDEISGKVNC